MLSDQIPFKLPATVQLEGTITSIVCYKDHTLKTILYYIGCLLSAGFVYLFGRWDVKTWISMRLVKSTVQDANWVLVSGEDKTITICDVNPKSMTIDGRKDQFQSFIYRFYTYYFDPSRATFIPIELNLSVLQNNEVVKHMSGGIATQEQLAELQIKYGSNSTCIPDRGLLNVMIDEILSPFYIFQIFSVTLWIYEEYINYSIAIIILSVLSIGQTVYDYRVNFLKLQKIANTEYKVLVFRFTPSLTEVRNGKVEINEDILKQHPPVIISSFELVPGDIVEITDNMIAPCDLIVLNGQTVMNEAMLTGESIPVTKSPLPFNNFMYSSNEDGKQSTMLAGTMCIETKVAGKGRIPVLAVVTETSFNTLKGQLIRSILYTPENAFKFYSDSLKFILALVLMALIEFLITVKTRVDQVQEGLAEQSDVIVSVFDLVTVAIPPALPTCMQIGVSIGVQRLKTKHIYCISPQKVNIAGKITVMCFDKTGTLTEDGLDLYGIRPASSNTAKNMIFGPIKLDVGALVESYGSKSQFDELRMDMAGSGGFASYISLLIVNLMACCHGLTQVGDRIIGDPLDEKLFEATGFEISKVEQEGIAQTLYPNRAKLFEIQTLRKFEFSAKLQRMSVIAASDDQTIIYCKGSPEKLQDLCLPWSIPQYFQETLQYYAQSGFRVIACGIRVFNLPMDQLMLVEREEIEKDLIFLGFIILENKLKRITPSVIEHLQSANLRTIMITGDNILTAISVAKSCNIIQPQQRVFYGEMKQNKAGTKQKIVWKDFEGTFVKMNFEDMNQSEIPSNNRHPIKTLKEEEVTIIRQSGQPLIHPEVPEDQLSEYDKMNLEQVLPWKSTRDTFVIALTGNVFSYLLTTEGPEPSQLFSTILENGQVYARMKPDEKGTLIKQLQTKLKRKPLVGFCGDGANDCNALKAADVGISLSPAEASIAAPFTSNIQDISCVPILLMEGRAALVASFNCFKYMVMYSVVQSVSVCILYFSFTNLTDGQFFFIDLFIILPLSGFMGFTHTTEKLTKSVPKGSLISFPVISSIFGQAIIHSMFLMTVHLKLVEEPWVIRAIDLPADQTDQNYTHTYESTSISLISFPMYLFIVMAFSSGKPFRKEFYTNIYFTTCLVLLLVFVYSLFAFHSYDNPFNDQLGFLFSTNASKMPESWIGFLVWMSILNGVITLVYERIIVPYMTNLRSEWKESSKRKVDAQLPTQ